MGRMVGADPEELDELGRAMAGAARQVSARVRSQWHAISWSGSDAESFRPARDAVHRRILGAAATGLHDAVAERPAAGSGYDFDGGMSDIATGTPDDENDRFAVLGGAKPFDTAGQLTRTITQDVGDAGGVSAGDGDVSRNPTTEDRPDELGTGRPAWPPIPGTTPLDSR